MNVNEIWIGGHWYWHFIFCIALGMVGAQFLNFLRKRREPERDLLSELATLTEKNKSLLQECIHQNAAYLEMKEKYDRLRCASENKLFREGMVSEK